jgi:hypothetical protein
MTQRIARAFRNFEPNWSIGLALDDKNTGLKPVIGYEICDFQPDEIAASRFAVDNEVKLRQAPEIARKFKSSTNSPDLFRENWSFLANQPSLAPRSAF